MTHSIVQFALFAASFAIVSAPALGDQKADDAGDRLEVAVAYLGLGITTTSAWVWPLFALYGCYTALTDGVGKAWVADLLPADREGHFGLADDEGDDGVQAERFANDGVEVGDLTEAVTAQLQAVRAHAHPVLAHVEGRAPRPLGIGETVRYVDLRQREAVGQLA